MDDAVGFFSIDHFAFAREFSFVIVDEPFSLFEIVGKGAFSHETAGLVKEFDGTILSVRRVCFFASNVAIDVVLRPDAVAFPIFHFAGCIDDAIGMIGGPGAIERIFAVIGRKL